MFMNEMRARFARSPIRISFVCHSRNTRSDGAQSVQTGSHPCKPGAANGWVTRGGLRLRLPAVDRPQAGAGTVERQAFKLRFINHLIPKQLVAFAGVVARPGQALRCHSIAL